MDQRPQPDKRCHTQLEWRPLPTTTIELCGPDFGKSSFALDPTLFPSHRSLSPWLEGSKPVAQHSIGELTEAGCLSMQSAFKKLDQTSTPTQIEETLRAHLGGILLAFAEKDPTHAPRIVSGQYVALRESRFLEQARAIEGGLETFERCTGLIADGLGLDLVLFGEYGVEGAVNSSNMHALQGLITLTEGLIRRAYELPSLTEVEKVQDALNREAEGLGDCVTKIVRSPFALIAHCSVGGQRALIEDNFLEGGTAPLKQQPAILVHDTDYCEEAGQGESIQRGLSKSVEGFFNRHLYPEKSAPGSRSYAGESGFVRWMLFGAE